jgi:hypothetical protein
MDAYHTQNEHQCYVWAREHAEQAWFNHGVVQINGKFFYVRDSEPGTFNGVFTCEPDGLRLGPSMLPDPAVEESRKEKPQVTTGAQHTDWISVPTQHGAKVRDVIKMSDGFRRAVVHFDFVPPSAEVAYAEEFDAYDCEQPGMQQNLETTVFRTSGSIFSHHRQSFEGSRWTEAPAGSAGAQIWLFVCSLPALQVPE